MWQEFRTPKGKLVFKIDFEKKLVQSAKDGYIVMVCLTDRAVIHQRKAAQKKR